MKRLLTVTLLAAAIGAAAEPAVGTWKLNIAKSKLTNTPRSQVMTITQAGNGRTLENHAVAADGKETHTKATSIFDGKEHPYTGTDGGYDSYIASGGGYVYVVEFKKGGKAVRTAKSTYSKNGKTRTAVAIGVDENGKAYNTVSVYDRQ